MHRRQPLTIIVTTVLAVGVLSLLLAGCGGGSAGNAGVAPSTTATTPTEQNGAVAFARCMRSHRVPNWPDPDSSGVFDKSKLAPQRLGIGSSQVQAAQRTCNHLLPSGGSVPSPAQAQQVRAQALKFSQCVRNHGVPNFPDPGSDGRIPDPATVGINQGSPKFEAANQACRTYRPPYMPSNDAYNAYARTHG